MLCFKFLILNSSYTNLIYSIFLTAKSFQDFDEFCQILNFRAYQINLNYVSLILLNCYNNKV